jgi:hypothetical protein
MCSRLFLACMACVLGLLGPATASVVLAGGGDCPEAHVTVHQYDLYHPDHVELAFPSTAFDSTLSVGQGRAHIAFDHELATLSTSITSQGWFEVSFQVVERFDASGLAPGTPVNATLVYQVDGWSQNCGEISCGVWYWTSLAVSGQTVTADASHYGPGPFRTDLRGPLSLHVTLVAGTPLDATFSFYYRTPRFAENIHAEGSGHYEVVGLPSGVRAFTCHSGDVTPVRTRTWGSLKLTYR